MAQAQVNQKARPWDPKFTHADRERYHNTTVMIICLVKLNIFGLRYPFQKILKYIYSKYCQTSVSHSVCWLDLIGYFFTLALCGLKFGEKSAVDVLFVPQSCRVRHACQ